MCGGGGQVQDNSHLVAQTQADAAREAREADERRRQQEKEAFEQRLSGAYSGALGQAQDYFSSMGLDPAQYMQYITNTANQARSSVPQGAEQVGTFFDSLGERAYSTAEQSARARALRDIDSFAGTGFYRSLIGDDAVQPAQQAILAEQREAAERQAQNMAARGVVTDRGLAAALQEISNQSTRANRQLGEIGQSLVETGRGSLRDIATQGRSAANSLSLGNTFDPFSYQQDINKKTTSFFDSLGDNFRSYVPSDLFDTSGLSLAAGRGQGVQNLPFDPKALAGIFADDDDEKKNNSLFSTNSNAPALL